MGALFSGVAFCGLLSLSGLTGIAITKRKPNSKFNRWLDKVCWNDEPIFYKKGDDTNEQDRTDA